jgi:hypothetical protein
MGKVCNTAKTCADDCFIDGAFFANGASNPQSPCFVCNASQATHTWSLVDRETPSGSCSSGLTCDGAGRCRRENGQLCAAASDCASGNCSVAGVCTP